MELAKEQLDRGQNVGYTEQLGQISWSRPRHDSLNSAVLERATGSIDVFILESPHGLVIVVDEALHAAAPSSLRLLKQFKTAQPRVIGRDDLESDRSGVLYRARS